jgi:hypothetical protein
MLVVRVVMDRFGVDDHAVHIENDCFYHVF